MSTGYRNVIRTLRKKAEMSTLEGLKGTCQLQKERYGDKTLLAIPVVTIEKLLAVVDAVKEYDECPGHAHEIKRKLRDKMMAAVRALDEERNDQIQPEK